MIPSITPERLAAYLKERATITDIAEEVGRALAALRGNTLYEDLHRLDIDDDEVELHTTTTRYGGDDASLHYPTRYLHDPETSLLAEREAIEEKERRAGAQAQQEADRMRVKAEQSERAEYERLRKKYGDS